LVLLAAAQQELEKGLDEIEAEPGSRLAQHRQRTRQQLLQTLLFMPVAQQYRPWDLRSYTGQQLALMSGRERTYGYRTVSE
jgi:hypothetical protein